jgi:adenylate cyclase
MADTTIRSDESKDGGGFFGGLLDKWHNRKRRTWRQRFKSWFSPSRLIAIVILIGLGLMRAGDVAPMGPLRVKTFDLYQRLKPRESDQRPVYIVDIDEKSLTEIGQWPWPRNIIAQVVANLANAGAAVIGFDMFFTEPDRMSPDRFAKSLPNMPKEISSALNKMPNNDRQFARILKQTRTVLGQAAIYDAIEGRAKPPKATRVAFRNGDPRDFLTEYGGLTGNIPILSNSANGLGMVTISPEGDGVVRRVSTVLQIGKKIYPALTLEMLRLAYGQKAYIVNSAHPKSGLQGITDVRFQTKPKPYIIPTDYKGRVPVHFRPHDPDLYIPMVDVLNGTADFENKVKGKAILIGTSAEGLKDIRTSPINDALPGVEVHANLIETIFSRSFLKRPSNALGNELVAALVCGFLMIWLVPNLGAAFTAFLALSLIGAMVGYSWWEYSGNIFGMFTLGEKANLNLIDATYPAASTFILYTFLTYSSYAKSAAERKQVRGAFAQYLSPALVEQLADEPERLTLGGEMRDMTVLFADIRGFTAISEQFKTDPQGLTNLINRFLTPMTDMILERRGTIDKYMGDCIMAFWNAPLDDADHVTHACDSALAMFSALEGLNADIKAERDAAGELFLPIIIGIGLNSGEACVGNMGSNQRFDYSVLGDTINLGARLESQSKNYGVGIVIGDLTYQGAPGYAMLEMDFIAVKGKTEGVHIYCLQGRPDMAETPAFKALAEKNAAMLEAYRGQQWSEARTMVAECRELDDFLEKPLDVLYDMYDERIGDYEINPPAADWDGVFVATSK